MNDQTQDGQQRTSIGMLGEMVLWLTGVFILYILISGPGLMLAERGMIRPNAPAWRAALILYNPVGWAYDETFLHKPLGIYWHLWVPRWFDTKGNNK